ncbi:hypothetical protein N0V86_002875 [Didymella sp. IMI 355093]|nr:hypothetical protein N0V86_002875 [Didymella sp. IMI 355093]
MSAHHHDIEIYQIEDVSPLEKKDFQQLSNKIVVLRTNISELTRLEEAVMKEYLRSARKAATAGKGLANPKYVKRDRSEIKTGDRYYLDKQKDIIDALLKIVLNSHLVLGELLNSRPVILRSTKPSPVSTIALGGGTNLSEVYEYIEYEDAGH